MALEMLKDMRSLIVGQYLEFYYGRPVSLIEEILIYFSACILTYAFCRFLLRLRDKRRIESKICHFQQKYKKAKKIFKSKLESNERRQTVVIDNITKLPLEELIYKMKNKELHPKDVLYAYQCKAIKADDDVNCVVEPFFEANDWCSEVVKNGDKGPLYGVPVSLKDIFGVKGYDASGGILDFLDQPYSEDAVIVQVLKRQGAVPFVKTPVPQTMLSYDCHNSVQGQTYNPLDKKRTPGGSSGGEGALMAAGGSIIGFGGDIGGSIRIPASFCGICGFKPTAGRLSVKGLIPFLKGQDLLQSSIGPFGRDVSSLVLAMKSVMVPYMYELDPTVPPMSFNTEVYESKKRLKIGFYYEDGCTPVTPACRRAVEITKAALEKQGHTLVEWSPYKTKTNIPYFYGKCVLPDGGKYFKNFLMKDRVCKVAVANLNTVVSTPQWIRSIIAFLVKPFMPRLHQTIEATNGFNTITEYWYMGEALKKWRNEFTEQWQSEGFDCLICPSFACPALPIGYPAYCTSGATYTCLYNLLNFPAGVVPVSKVTKEDEDAMKDYPTFDLQHKWIKKGMVGSRGLPVSVQCVALTWQDEMCLRLMKDVEEAIKTD